MSWDRTNSGMLDAPYQASSAPLPDPGELERVISQLVDVRLRMAYLKRDADRLAGLARALLPVGTEKQKIADVLVSVVAPMKFSPERAQEILSPEVVRSISRPMIDKGLAEKILTGAAFDACKVPDTARIVITPGGK